MRSAFDKTSAKLRCAPVAQLDRVPGYEPGGRGFESCLAHHSKKQPSGCFFISAREKNASLRERLSRKVETAGVFNAAEIE